MITYTSKHNGVDFQSSTVQTANKEKGTVRPIPFPYSYPKGHYRISILSWPPDLAIFLVFFNKRTKVCPSQRFIIEKLVFSVGANRSEDTRANYFPYRLFTADVILQLSHTGQQDPLFISSFFSSVFIKR